MLEDEIVNLSLFLLEIVLFLLKLDHSCCQFDEDGGGGGGGGGKGDGDGDGHGDREGRRQ
jgi:hypothetical protein